MQLDLFDYQLPKELIAQHPAPQRDASRLLVLERASGRVQHCRSFSAIENFLRSGDLLVYNDTRVIPAKLVGQRSTGGRVEALVIRRDGTQAEVWLQTRGKLLNGEVLQFGDYQARLQRQDQHSYLDFSPNTVDQVLEQSGQAPLPPYIRRRGCAPQYLRDDQQRYQTVYAKAPGAIAAPTAGLHFTKELLERLRRQGIQIANVTLHVGPGTFLPIRTNQIDAHQMQAEEFILPEQTARKIQQARKEHRRIIAVGTTTCRVLETQGRSGSVHPGRGHTNLYIYPGFEFKVINGLVTNFHLPKSTLLLLVAALVGTETILAVYRQAVAMRYRFYSYGDAMLILP